MLLLGAVLTCEECILMESNAHIPFEAFSQQNIIVFLRFGIAKINIKLKVNVIVMRKLKALNKLLEMLGTCNKLCKNKGLLALGGQNDEFPM